MTIQSIRPFEGDFCSVVTNHVKALPAGELQRLRQYALDGATPWIDEPAVDAASAEDLVKLSLRGHSDLSIDQLLKWGAARGLEVVGEVGGQPVYYVDGTGLYAWGLARTTGPVWEVTLTFPSYPPSW